MVWNYVFCLPYFDVTMTTGAEHTECRNFRRDEGAFKLFALRTK